MKEIPTVERTRPCRVCGGSAERRIIGSDLHVTYVEWICEPCNRLLGVFDSDSLKDWIDKPNPAFEGVTPKQVIREGRWHLIYGMIYRLQSGDPS